MKKNKLLLLPLIFLCSCLTYPERYQRADIRHQAEDIRLDAELTETPSQRARRILDRRSQFVKNYMMIIPESPITDIWIRRPEILEKTSGDCDDAMFDIGDYALINNVDPELFTYCILRRFDYENTLKYGIKLPFYEYHAVLLLYSDKFNGEIITTTGIISDISIVSLEDCYDLTGYYPYESWHVVNGEWIEKDGELFYIGELKIYKHKPFEEDN